METKRPKYIDFHLHTEYSDGVSSPEHLARVAAINDLDVIAITDHDKIDGYERARVEGEKWGLVVIPGVEVSTDKYHILGLGINPSSTRFRNFLEESAQEQKKVSIARIEVLRKQGIPITLEKLEKTFPEARLGKMNLWWAMMQDKECRAYFEEKGEKLTEELYKRYLRNNQAREPIDKNTAINSERAINEIHEADGIAIIAHPFKDVKDMAEMDELRRLGIEGLEIQANFNGQNEPFREYAKQHNLLVTYGSDWHAGLFERVMLDGKSNGENVLYERLARTLRLEEK
jgi:predicted metal-dependent phosphoesterase TrpH